MKVSLRNGLPFVTAALMHRGRQIELPNVLLDTGSAGTIFAADQVYAMGLRYEADDTVYRIRGVGGSEFVFSKRIDRLSLGELQVNNFDVEVGAMEYGMEINGIVGMDFLVQIGAVIDLSTLEVRA